MNVSSSPVVGHLITDYQISLPAFSGPLDLLLHLIERNELDITAVSLAEVTGQYLAQIESLKEGRLEHLIDFLLIGARLALIKSRALLPQPPVAFAEDEAEEDPAEALLRQLRAYRRFKQAAQWLQQRAAQGLRTHLRVAPLVAMPARRLDVSGVTVAALCQATLAALARTESLAESVAMAQPRQITIEGQIKRLRLTLQQQRPFLFHEVLSAPTNRVEVAVTLLAILELVKQREISVTQAALFGPIQIVPTPKAAPAL